MRIQCCGQGAVNDIGTLDNVTGADLLLVLSDPLANAHIDIANWTRGDTRGHGGGHGGTERVSTLQNRMFKSMGAINIFSMENVWTRNSICHVLMTFDKQQKLI